MTAAERDRVYRMVHEHGGAALQQARGIEAPLYRAQALAQVARFAAPDQVLPLAQESLAAAADCADAYDQVLASAWPLRCLMELGQQDQALTMLDVVLHAVPRVERSSGRSEALLVLLQAVFDAGVGVRQSIVYAMSELVDSDPHWRVQHNFVQALLLCKDEDPDYVAKMARVKDEKVQRKLEQQLAEASPEPRTFFW